MKPWLALLVFAMPAMGQEDDPEMTASTQAIREYRNCVTEYLAPRIDWNATAHELADASLSACVINLSDYRDALRNDPKLLRASVEQLVANLQDIVRLKAVQLVLEARNPAPKN